MGEGPRRAEREGAGRYQGQRFDRFIAALVSGPVANMDRITGSIFTLDLGVTSGFARGRPGDAPVSGTVRLKKPSETIDLAYANLIAFLCEQFEADRPELLVKEKMLALQAFATIGNAEKTVRAHAAYHGIVEGICVRHSVRWMDVADSTARKHF